MKEEMITDALLREFLLGRVTDEERERIESLFLTDFRARDGVLTAEQDLIEDYLEDSLTKADKERFLSLYGQTDEQRRKLRITKSLKDWALTEARATQPVATPVSIWSRLGRELQLKPVFIVPIAVTIAIATVLGVVWLNSKMEQRKQMAVEQELAQLNSPASLRESPPQMISLELRPVTVRSVEPPRQLNPSAEIRIVELRLPWIQKERYLTYQAEVRRLGDDQSFTIRNLQAENDGGYAIRIRLPADMLSRGGYRILLSGIAPDGSPGPSEAYTFTVGG